MGILIERACPADAAEILGYLKTVGGETDNLSFGAEGLPFSIEEEEAYLRSLQNSTHCVMLVARKDGRIVGNASFTSSPRERLKHRGELGICVLKKEWGNGIATMLMDEILRFARDTAQAGIIHLEVRSDNLRAIRLYRKFGFVKIGQFHGLLKIKGEYIDFDLMNLYL